MACLMKAHLTYRTLTRPASAAPSSLDMLTRVARGALAVGLAAFGTHYLMTLALPNFEQEERARNANR